MKNEGLTNVVLDEAVLSCLVEVVCDLVHVGDLVDVGERCVVVVIVVHVVASCVLETLARRGIVVFYALVVDGSRCRFLVSLLLFLIRFLCLRVTFGHKVLKSSAFLIRQCI